MIDKPGVFAMPAADYHADPVAAPSLSASVAQLLVSRSPAHAREAHPRLNPAWEASEPTSEQEEGTALHALLLEREDRVVVVDAKDWRAGPAQAARKTARAAGQVAILTHRWVELCESAAAMRRALAAHEVGDFLALPGRAEQVMVWQEETELGPIWMRSRVDWMPDTLPALFDLKTLGGSAEPDSWGRKALRDGAALQCAIYLRGCRALGLPYRQFLFCLLERDAPHGVSIVALAPSLLAMADEQFAYAKKLWAVCLRDGNWPAYPPYVATIEASTGALYGHADWQQRIEQMRTRAPKQRRPSEEAFIVNAEQPWG